MANSDQNLAYFWAKTTSEGKPGISVYDHMKNVGYVAHCVAEMAPQILDRFHLQPSIISAFAALHDLGKICPGFQQKCEVWLEEKGLSKIARNYCWDTSMESDHGKVSHAAIQSFLLAAGIDRTSAKFVSCILGAHHGHLSPPNDRGYRPQKAISETYSGIDWDAARMTNAQLIWDRFVGNGTQIVLSDESPFTLVDCRTYIHC